jgi:hypothetical protein
MGRSVDRIEAIGLVQALRDLTNALRANDRQRKSFAATRPPQNAQFTQAIDMVGVKMGQEDRFNQGRRVPDPSKVSRGAGARIDEKERIPSDDGHAGGGTTGIGKRPARTTKCDVEALWQVTDHIGAHIDLDPCAHQANCDRAPERPNNERRTNDDHKNRQQEFSHV